MEERCQRPGCAGKIVDGFCEDCGRAPAGKSLVASAVTGAAAKAEASARNTGPTRTGSALKGSSAFSSGRTGTKGTGRSSARSTRVSTRRTLGAGLVSLPPLPSMDPLKSLMPDPVVPDRKRYCGACDAKLNHEKGFCPMCGHEYSFVPSLKPGDVIAGQYEVKGAIAFGGLGWIYLGWDTRLSRWVVLKGLLNTKDEQSAAAAVAERQFLASVKHPKIVGIYNFVSEGSEGYIVMEYVGGKTLKTIRQERGPLPPTEAIAYIYAILPAFAYLERMGLVYCDFKPDNIMLEDDDVKLIDMGGVRRVDDMDGDIYGTKGYTAPEANESPSFVSDLYTVARTLAVLMFDFKFQGAYEHTLPTPAEQPLFAQYDSLYRWFLRATAKEPDDRFQIADEMAEQLLGVLREMVAAESKTPRPADSTHFSGEAMLAAIDETVFQKASPAMLPALKVDPLDPAANAILAAGMSTPAQRRFLFTQAGAKFPESMEARLRLADTLIAEGAYGDAEAELAAVHAADPFDWRVWWYRGKSLLTQVVHDARTADNSSATKSDAPAAFDAVSSFDTVYSELPGELAPKLAIALACEAKGDDDTALYYYDLVSRTDPNYVSASFGLARCRLKTGDRDGAAEAYSRVPATSSLYTQAQIALTRAMLLTTPTPPGEPELRRASETLSALALDGLALHRLSADLLLTAIDRLTCKGVAANPSCQVLGQALEERALRAKAEQELRSCARYVKTTQERIALVDQANAIRPTSLF